MYHFIFLKGSPKTEDIPTLWTEDSFLDSMSILKKNVNDTLTFLHRERNDFLPEDDIIIPRRKDDHISKEINLDSISLKNLKLSIDEYDDSLRENLKNAVDEVIKEAENVINQNLNTQSSFEDQSNVISQLKDDVVDIKDHSGVLSQLKDEDIDVKDQIEEKLDSVFDDIKTITEDSLENVDSLKDDSVYAAQEKSEEAFKFLENEIVDSTTSPVPSITSFLEKEREFSQEDIGFENISSKSPKSAIPVAKPRKSVEKDIEGEKDYDFSNNKELLSKIPVMKSGKVKTIKKHSKDPLKEFVTLSKDVNWDDDSQTEIIKTVTVDPIVKTTVTRIVTSETSPENVKSKIPVLQTDSLSLQSPEAQDLCESELTPKSKIPVLKTETTKISSPEPVMVEHQTTSPDFIRKITETMVISPGLKVSTKNGSTIDSDSDEDSRRSPPLKGILKKSGLRTIGSSSGSDIALHEEGAELSEDDPGMSFNYYCLEQL